MTFKHKKPSQVLNMAAKPKGAAKAGAKVGAKAAATTALQGKAAAKNAPKGKAAIKPGAKPAEEDKAEKHVESAVGQLDPEAPAPAGAAPVGHTAMAPEQDATKKKKRKQAEDPNVEQGTAALAPFPGAREDIAEQPEGKKKRRRRARRRRRV